MADAGYNDVFDTIELELRNIIKKLEDENITINEAVRRKELLNSRFSNLLEGRMNYRGEDRRMYDERLADMRELYWRFYGLIAQMETANINRPKGGEPPNIQDLQGASRASQIMGAILAKKKANKLGKVAFEPDRPKYISKYILRKIIKKVDKNNYKQFKKDIKDLNIPYKIPANFSYDGEPEKLNLYFNWLNLLKEGDWKKKRGEILEKLKKAEKKIVEKSAEKEVVEKKKKGRPFKEEIKVSEKLVPEWAENKQLLEKHFKGLDLSETVMGLPIPKNKLKTKKDILGNTIKYFIDEDGEEGMTDKQRVEALGKEEFIKVVMRYYKPEDRTVKNIPIQFNIDVKGVLEPKEEKQVQQVLTTKKPDEKKLDKVDELLESKVNKLKNKVAKRKLKKIIDLFRVKRELAQTKKKQQEELMNRYNMAKQAYARMGIYLDADLDLPDKTVEPKKQQEEEEEWKPRLKKKEAVVRPKIKSPIVKEGDPLVKPTNIQVKIINGLNIYLKDYGLEEETIELWDEVVEIYYDDRIELIFIEKGMSKSLQEKNKKAMKEIFEAMEDGEEPFEEASNFVDKFKSEKNKIVIYVKEEKKTIKTSQKKEEKEIDIEVIKGKMNKLKKIIASKKLKNIINKLKEKVKNKKYLKELEKNMGIKPSEVKENIKEVEEKIEEKGKQITTTDKSKEKSKAPPKRDYKTISEAIERIVSWIKKYPSGAVSKDVYGYINTALKTIMKKLITYKKDKIFEDEKIVDLQNKINNIIKEKGSEKSYKDAIKALDELFEEKKEGKKNDEKIKSDEPPKSKKGAGKLRGGRPSDKAYLLASQSSYLPKALENVNGYIKIYDGETIDAFLNRRNKEILVGVKGTTLNAKDLLADVNIARNNLRNTNRYKKDVEQFKQILYQYPPSEYIYYVSGHSLGGAIIKQLRKDFPFIKEGQGFNPASQPKDLITQDPNILDNYIDKDFLYNTTGRFIKNKRVYPYVAQPTKGIFGWIKQKSTPTFINAHFLDNFNNIPQFKS